MKMLLVLTLVTVCAVFLASAEVTSDAETTWELLYDSTECKSTISSVAASHAAAGEETPLKDLLEEKNCALTDMQCLHMYINPFVNTATFQLSEVAEADNTYVVEMYCYKGPGEPLYGPGQNASFLIFVSNAENQMPTESQMESFTFYKDITEMGKMFPDFALYYDGAREMMASLFLIVASMMVPAFVQHVM